MLPPLYLQHRSVQSQHSATKSYSRAELSGMRMPGLSENLCEGSTAEG